MKTVLVVDNDRTNLNFVTHTLALAGFRVLPAEDAEAASEFCNDEPIDFTLVDDYTLRIDPVTWHKSLGGESKLIVMSRNQKSPLIATSFVMKPFDRDQLLDCFD